MDTHTDKVDYRNSCAILRQYELQFQVLELLEAQQKHIQKIENQLQSLLNRNNLIK